MTSVNKNENWFGENKIKEKIVEKFRKTGHPEVELRDKAMHGPDIEVKKGNHSLFIEVKGYPSDKYEYGPKKGQKKTRDLDSQAKKWFGVALFTLLKIKCDNWDNEIAFGLPNYNVYLQLINNMKRVFEIFELKVYIVNINGEVKEMEY